MFNLKTTIDLLKKRLAKRSPASTIPTDNRFAHKYLGYYKTPLGNYFLPTDASNDIISQHMKDGKIFKPEVVEVASRYIRKSSIVLDIGANFGQMSMLFSRMVGESGQVLSFEADDFVYYVLSKNIDANNCQNIRAFFAAVYDKSGEIKYFPLQDFKRFSAYGSYGLDPNAVTGRTVATLAIDDLKIRDPISFIKVDVQGSDLFALRGAVQTIKKYQMPILFEYEEQFQAEFNTSFQDYLDFIYSIAYKVERTVNGINYLIVPDTRKLIASTSKTADQSIVSSNADQINARSKFEVMDGPDIMAEPPMCKFLKSRQEIEECTALLHHHGFVSHSLFCKNWDLAHILPRIGDGNFLDMGSSDSYILRNVALKRIRGELYGIDLCPPDNPVWEVKYIVGNLMDTGLSSNYFKNITCLSVIEHEVDFDKFAYETSRLLQDKGKLFVTFDYWDPKIISPVKMYGLDWQILDKRAVEDLVATGERYNLYLIQDIDWTIGDAVIKDGYFSPHPKVSYTFGLMTFEKRIS